MTEHGVGRNLWPRYFEIRDLRDGDTIGCYRTRRLAERALFELPDRVFMSLVEFDENGLVVADAVIDTD